MQQRIACLAEVVAVCRTHIFRSNYGSREIEYVPEPEANTRISKGLAGIVRGIAALRQHSTVLEEDFEDSVRVGLDCLPENRRRLLEAAIKKEDLKGVSMPETVRRRDLEDLAALEVLEPEYEDDPLDDGRSRKVSSWKLTIRVEKLLARVGLLEDRVPVSEARMSSRATT